MARPPLTLAALATAAIPGLEIVATVSHTRSGQGDFDAARLVQPDGTQLIIRVSTSQSAELEQSADLVALNALTKGIRAQLPFTVPRLVGQTPIDDTRAVVTTFIDGKVCDVDELTSGNQIADSVGVSVAAVHNLPAGFISDSGLPRRSTTEIHNEVVGVIGRASDTGRLPKTLERRWQQATDDETLWRFQPTVVNGALTADSFVVEEGKVKGIIGWAQLMLGDPAEDLKWLFTARGKSTERLFDTYLLERNGAVDSVLPQRALLYGELELARWLLYGVESHEDTIIADASEMLGNLVERVENNLSEPLAPTTAPILTVKDVEIMLDDRPGLPRPIWMYDTVPVEPVGTGRKSGSESAGRSLPKRLDDTQDTRAPQRSNAKQRTNLPHSSKVSPSSTVPQNLLPKTERTDRLDSERDKDKERVNLTG